jgi:RNA polymerase sigma-70 factor, ECF subfamily
MLTKKNAEAVRTANERATERLLIDRVLLGDESAAHRLYAAHAARVLRVCLSVADGDVALAEDFTQEAFVRAFANLSRFRRESSLSTWLHRIAVCVSLSGMRKVRRHWDREVPLQEADTVPQSEGPERLVLEEIRSAVDSLPDGHRQVFIMFHEGYSHVQIGSALNIPTGTSKARLCRARSKLREELVRAS